ncbi:MAG: DUF1569 domain-containing protein [Gemmatimonadetes bacterium]|nr:DUF1569 domain-containing protein [Gemmatimonadota bacterium]
MPSLFEPAVRDQCVSRIAKLTPDTPSKWGKFTATQMVAHLNESMRMAMGELAVAPKPTGLLRTAFVRWLIIYVLPFPKSAPTAPELLARGKSNAVELDAERALYKELLAKLAARQGSSTWPDHPAFGSMTEARWGALGAKHTDHHLRQFGI